MIFTKGVTNFTSAFSCSRKTIAKLSLGMAFVGGLLASASANAGYVIDATIVKVRATEFNAYFVFVDQAITQPAACATSSVEKVFVFDPSTAAGKAMLQTVLAARALNTKVTIYGRGNYPTLYTTAATQCSLWGGVETINLIDLQ